MPQRGPEASQRMSLAILVRETAIVLSAPEPRPPRPWRPGLRSGSAPARTGGRCASRAARSPLGESGGELSPVPTAVPPSGSSARRGLTAREPRRAVAHLRRVARELLPQADRHRVLQVGAADLHDVVELARLRAPARRPAARAPARGPRRSRRGRDVDRGRNDVVGGLPRLTWSLGWTGFFGPSRRRGSRWPGSRSPRWRSCWSRCPSRSGRCRRKLSSSLPSATSSRRRRDRLGELGVEDPHLVVHRRRLALDQPQRGDERRREGEPGDREVAPRALGLGAVVGVGRDLISPRLSFSIRVLVIA